MKVELCTVDELNLILQSAQTNALAFEMLREKKDFAAVRSFFTGTKSLIYEIDKQMTALGLRDHMFAVLWASRMATIITHLDHIERNLPHSGTRLFDWNQVLQSMGLVLAFRVGAEQTIGLNEHLLAA